MSNFNKVDVLTGVRRMFYAVTPNETSFKTVEEVPRIINEANPFFWMFLALELVISKVKHDHKYRMNDALTSISAGMFSRLPLLLVKSIIIQSYIFIYNHYRITELPWDSSWTWLLTFLGVDLGYYWFHRLAHEVNFMWAFHQTHHSSEDYNLSTALRQSLLQMYTSWVFYLPLAFFVPPAMFLVHEELNILYQFWIHTQYIKSLGPLEYILNTPSHHRVHHGRNPYCIDKNYAGTLIIWDRLFGTYEAENDEVVYGLTHPVNTFDPFTLQFGYTKYLIQRTLDFQGLTNKLKSVFYGPGWSPGKPRMGDIKDIPQVDSVIKYDVRQPKWLSIYVFIHFLLFSLGYQELMARHMGFSQTSVFIFVAYLLFNLTCFGRIFDNSTSSKFYELVRCFSFLIGEMIICQLGFYGDRGYRPWYMYGIQVCFANSCGLWVAQIFVGCQKENVKKCD